MAALANKRARKEETFKLVELTLASGTKAFHNARICFRSDGKVVPATSVAGLIPIGVALSNPADSVDATAGDKTVTVDLEKERQGEWWANATAADAVLATDMGKVVYMLDDQTVTITPTGRSPVGRAWRLSTTKGVLVETLAPLRPTMAQPAATAFVANDSAPTALEHNAVYSLLATAAASTVTLPAAAPDGTTVHFVADGTANGHTVQYRDATGLVALTTALLALKRHLVIATKVAGKWFANAYVSP